MKYGSHEGWNVRPILVKTATSIVIHFLRIFSIESRYSHCRLHTANKSILNDNLLSSILQVRQTRPIFLAISELPERIVFILLSSSYFG